MVNDRRAEAVLLTGVYGSGKSSVAAEIAYEDITISNDRSIAVVAQELMTFLGWP